METEIRNEEDSSVSITFNMSKADLGILICSLSSCLDCFIPQDLECMIPSLFPPFRLRMKEALAANAPAVRRVLEDLRRSAPHVDMGFYVGHVGPGILD